MVLVLLFPKYLYFHLFVCHLSCVTGKNINTAPTLALGKYLLIGKEINPVCKGLVVCVSLAQEGGAPTVV